MEDIIIDTLAEVRNLWDKREFEAARELCDTLLNNGYESIAVYEAKAVTFSLLAENDKALKCFKTLLDMYKDTPTSSEDYENLTCAVFTMCEILIIEKQYQESLNYLQQFLTKDDDYILVNTTLSKALIGLERYQEAIEALNVITKCKDLSAQDKKEARNLKRKCNRALNPVVRKITKDKDSLNVTKLFNKIERYLEKEQYDKAIESAQILIDEYNESCIGFEFMAMALIGQKRYEEALFYCNMALERITDSEIPPYGVSHATQLKRDCIDAFYIKKHSLEENIDNTCEQSDISLTQEISDNEKEMEVINLNSLDVENNVLEETDITYYQNDILQKYVKFGYKSMGDDISITYLENGVRCLEEYEICTIFSIAMPTFLEFIDNEYFDKEDLEVSIKLKGQELLYNDGTVEGPIFYKVELPDTGENVVLYGKRKSTLPVLPIDLKITSMTISEADFNFVITEYDDDYEDGEQDDIFFFYSKEDKTILGDRLQYFKNAIINHLDEGKMEYYLSNIDIPYAKNVDENEYRFTIEKGLVPVSKGTIDLYWGGCTKKDAIYYAKLISEKYKDSEKNPIIANSKTIESKKTTCSIFYDNWQMQCCGEPFKIGDVIDWEVLSTKNTIHYGKSIDYYYEAHNAANNPYYNIKGTVKHIYITSSESSKELIEICEVDFNNTYFESDIIIELEDFECSDLIIPKDNVDEDDDDDFSFVLDDVDEEEKPHDYSVGKATANRLTDNIQNIYDCIEAYNYIYAMCNHGFTLDADMYSNLSEIYEHLAEYGIALNYMNKALETRDGTIRDYGMRAGILSDLERLDESIESYKVALSLYKGDEDDFYSYIVTFLNMGEMFFSKKRYEEAIECFNNVIEYEKEDDVGYVSVARCLLELKQYEKSLEYCELASRYIDDDDPFSFQLYETKAKCLLALGQNEEAEKYFKYAERDKPYFPISTCLIWEDESYSCNEFETREEAFEHIQKNITEGDAQGTNKVVEAQIVGEKLIRSRFLGIDY